MIASNLITLAALVFLVVEGMKALKHADRKLTAVLVTLIAASIAVLLIWRSSTAQGGIMFVAIVIVTLAAMGVHRLWKKFSGR